MHVAPRIFCAEALARSKATSRYQSFCERARRIVLNGSFSDVPENDPMRDVLSNGGLHVVVPPQELCKGSRRGGGERLRGENGRTEVEEDFGGRF